MKHKDGHWVDILSRAEAVFNENGKAVRMIGTHVDILIEKNTAQLEESEEKYRILIETASDAIYLMAEDGFIIDTNQGACDMLGSLKMKLLDQQ